MALKILTEFRIYALENLNSSEELRRSFKRLSLWKENIEINYRLAFLYSFLAKQKGMNKILERVLLMKFRF